MWDLPGPGLEPMSPTLAGRFLTTAPPGKSNKLLLTSEIVCATQYVKQMELNVTYRAKLFSGDHWTQNTAHLISPCLHMCYLYINFNNFYWVLCVRNSCRCLRYWTQNWGKMCTIGSYVSVQAGSRAPLGIREKEEWRMSPSFLSWATGGMMWSSNKMGYTMGGSSWGHCIPGVQLSTY